MFVLSELTEKYAREICSWKYENEYSVYNYPGWDEISVSNWPITDPDRRKSEFEAILIEQDGKTELFGYFSFAVKGQSVILGLGLKPKFCGKGYGSRIMNLIIEEYKKLYSDKTLELLVRTFNKRAIKCYSHAGFAIKKDSFTIETKNGKDKFLLMKYN